MQSFLMEYMQVQYSPLHYLHTLDTMHFVLMLTVSLLSVLYLFILLTVSIPNVTALGSQTVGESLTLQCRVTIMGNISNSVNIVWRDDSGRLNSTGVTSVTLGMYTDSYTIEELSTTDDDRVIWCEVVINTVMFLGNITLNVIGEFTHSSYIYCG